MACDNITDILTRESGRFYGEIYNRVFPRSPWIGLVKRTAFPDGHGIVLSNLTYERSAPTDAEPTWSTMTVTDGTEGGSCLPSATKIAIGSTTRTWQLKRRVLEGPDFCVTDLRYDFQLRDQLEQIIGILSEYTLLEWEMRYRHDYMLLCGNKQVVNGGLPLATNASGSSFSPALTGASCPTSVLTQGVLNRAKQRLLRDGAAMSAMGKEDGAPVLTLICSGETSDKLIFDNADIRQDLRWGKPNELLAPYGVTRSYRGFYHLIDQFPSRFTCSGGTYTEVAPFTTQATTKGNRAIVNPLWEAAPYEASYIFDNSVFESQVPKPITDPHPDFKFDPVTYLGDWKLKNIIDRVCNPDGTIVFHRGHMGEAPKPVHPERGWAFIHLRCDPSANLVTACS